MTIIKIVDVAGYFAENKDIARDLRLKQIMPALDKEENVTLNFEGVQGATQSFIHALISDIFRKYPKETLDSLAFEKCNDSVKEIISIVFEYMQES